MEIIQERIEREFKIDLITTAPSVIYKVFLTNGEDMIVDNPSNMPDPQIMIVLKSHLLKLQLWFRTTMLEL